MLSLLATSCVRGQKTDSKMFADAEAYERFMGRWSRLIAPLLLDFTDIPDAGRVLDAGSGTGSLAFTIAGRRPRCQVVGIDPSKEYVSFAESRNRFGSRASFETGDAQQLHFAPATFQSSLSLFVINFIPDPEKALRELIRVTKPQGRISAAVWDYGSGMRMLRVFWDAVVSFDPPAERLDEKHMPLCRSGELAELWTKAGLTEVDEKPLDATLQFQSFADYWDPFLLGQGPAGAYVRRLDRVRAERLRAEVKNRLRLPRENVAFALPTRAWAVRGTVAEQPGRRSTRRP